MLEGKKGDKPRGVIKTEEERRRIWETAMDKTEGIFCYFCTSRDATVTNYALKRGSGFWCLSKGRNLNLRRI